MKYKKGDFVYFEDKEDDSFEKGIYKINGIVPLNTVPAGAFYHVRVLWSSGNSVAWIQPEIEFFNRNTRLITNKNELEMIELLYG